MSDQAARLAEPQHPEWVRSPENAGLLDIEEVQWLQAELARVSREAEQLREALRTICDIGETRDVEVARAALAAAGDRQP